MPEEQLYRYLVRQGEHIEAIPDPPPLPPGASPQEIKAREALCGRERKILQGHEFTSSNDWYARRWPEKFEALSDGALGKAPHAPVQRPLAMPDRQRYLDTFDEMTLPELRQYAAEEEIDLQGATRKDDILRILRAIVGVG